MRHKFVFLTGFAIAALVALAPTSAAKGAGANAFAGKFVGLVPGGGGYWTISIKGSGNISGKIADGFSTGSLSGTVDRDGRMKCSGTQRVGWPAQTINLNFTATATVNSDGDIVGTTDTGVTFVWVRQ